MSVGRVIRNLILPRSRHPAYLYLGVWVRNIPVSCQYHGAGQVVTIRSPDNDVTGPGVRQSEAGMGSDEPIRGQLSVSVSPSVISDVLLVIGTGR